MDHHIFYRAALWAGAAVGSLLATGCDVGLESGHADKSPGIPDALVKLRGNYWLGLTVILPRGGSPDVRYLPLGAMDPRSGIGAYNPYLPWPLHARDGDDAHEPMEYLGGSLLEPRQVRRFVDRTRILARPGDPKEYVNELQGVLFLRATRQVDDPAQRTGYWVPIYWYDNAFELWTDTNVWQFHNPVLAEMITSVLIEEAAMTNSYRQSLSRVAGKQSETLETAMPWRAAEHEEYLSRNRLHYWPAPVDSPVGFSEVADPGPEHELIAKIMSSATGGPPRDQDALDAMLHEAIEHGMWRATQLCLLAGADPLGKDPHLGDSAMEEAVRCLHNEEVLCLMLIATPKNDRPDPSTLLLDYANGWPADQGIRMLVAAGADPNGSGLAEAKGWTPLHRSVQRDSVPAVRALLELGAKPTRSPGGKTLLEMARSDEMRHFLGRVDIHGTRDTPEKDRAPATQEE